MKKTIIPIIAALIFSCMSLTTFATGWTVENGSWVYYDRNDAKALNAWRQSADGGYYYLGGDGDMVTSSFIDDRYVDSDGRMVTSAWRQIDGHWYFFDANGKMVQDVKRQISGKYYYFDYDGSMLTGWVQNDDEWYYCDPSDGHLIVGSWAQLEPDPGMTEADKVSNYNGLYSSDITGTYWFYFKSNGEAYHATENSYEEYTIGNERYAFDADGRMCVGWIKLTSTNDENCEIANYKYFNDSESLGTYGAAHVGWLSAYPPRDSSGYLGNGEVNWYYFNSRGEPYCTEDLDPSGTAEIFSSSGLKRITKNGETNTYLFNEYGNPVYGLRKVERTNGETTETTSMYFGTKEQSCVQYGAIRLTESGVTSTFQFTNTGYGVTGPYNGKLYYMGKLQRATGTSRMYINIEEGKTYLVNSSGTILKNINTSKDKDEEDYKTDSQGLDAGGLAAAYAESPDEPEFEVS